MWCELRTCTCVCVYVQHNYMYLKKCVESAPITPMQETWLDHMLTLVPAHLQRSDTMQEAIKGLVEEITNDFNGSMKKATGTSLDRV